MGENQEEEIEVEVLIVQVNIYTHKRNLIQEATLECITISEPGESNSVVSICICICYFEGTKSLVYKDVKNIVYYRERFGLGLLTYSNTCAFV